MDRLPWMLAIKQRIAEHYRARFETLGIQMAAPIKGSTANNWLNALIMADLAERDAFLAYSNDQGVMTRPIWRLMSHLEMFKHCQHDGLRNSLWLEARVVNIPSSVPDIEIGKLKQ